jgi:hypothetical protein
VLHWLTVQEEVVIQQAYQFSEGIHTVDFERTALKEYIHFEQSLYGNTYTLNGLNA